ncbi:MAG: hypothetical protein ACU85E_14025 [Gammaproteobacteria bacterium]
MTEKRLDHSLAVQLITGRPILLNDGYLIQHSLCIKAITDRDSLLWSLIDAGFVSILSRGFGRFPLQEMPVQMSTSVETMSLLINDKLTGAPPWNEYKKRLEDVDRRMRAVDNFVPWPRYDAGSGYSVFARRLLDRKSSPKSLGLTALRSDDVLESFLKEFNELLEKDMSAARTKWEQLAKRYADNPNYAKNPKKAHHELMVLANEIYHYNIGVMLSGSFDSPVSVETQVSAAFDDLLVVEDVILEESPEYPKLNVPRVVATAPPGKLVQILDPYRPVGAARLRWLALEKNTQSGTLEDKQAVFDAADEYAKRLSEHLGVSVSYKESEGLISFVAGKALSVPRDALLLGSAAAVGAASSKLGLPTEVAGIAGMAAGYVVSKLQKNLIGAVTKKVRIRVLEDQIRSDSAFRKMLQASESTLHAIMNRKVPSAIDMDPIQARRLLSQYKAFVA